MFKEILVFMLCLQFSNGSRNSWGVGEVTEDIGKNPSCKDKAAEFLEHFMPGLQVPLSKICILSNYQHEEIKEHPAKYSEPISQTNINIEISDFQLIRINEDSIRMSLYWKVEWVDQRLQVLQFQLTPAHKGPDYPFILQESEQESIWIPPLKLTSIISKGEDVDYVEAGPRILGNFTSGAWVAQSNYVDAEVECDLDFKTFPFDHHVCRIEVRI